ncbi:RepB family plasmid replication initiator protein, partial [Lactococcus lactis]
MELNSKYSIILYKWLSMNYNQYEHYSVKGGRRAEQVETYRNPSIKMSELRTLTDTVNEYKRSDHFEIWILKKPLEEINAHTHFNVTYEKIKKGRSIESIVFHIEKKRMADDNSYKLDDRAYQEDKARKAETEDQLVLQAMDSPYTKLLMEHFLLSYLDLMDKK